MKFKRGQCRFFISIFIIHFSVIGAAHGEGISLTSELYELDTIRTRISFINESCRYILIGEHHEGEISKLIIGFSSPIISFGPLSRFGLLREIFNPLGYGAGSSVFYEKTDLRLNAAFSAGSRKGILWEPIPGRLGLFLFKSDERPVKSGALFSLPLNSDFLAEALILTSLPDDELDFDEWFADKAPYPGGRLVHMCGRFMVKRPYFKLLASSVICSGERIIPGYLTDLNLGFKYRKILLDILFGASTRSYLTPDGKTSDDWLLAGSRIYWNPWEPFSMTGVYIKSIAHPAIYPEQFIESSDEFSLEGETDFLLNRNLSIGLQVKGSKEISFSDSGKRSQEVGIDCGISFTLFSLGLECEWIQDFEDGSRVQNRVKLESVIDAGRAQCSGAVDFFIEDSLEYFLSGRFDLDMDKYRFYLRLWTEKPLGPGKDIREEFLAEPLESISLTLGWEVGN